MLYFCVFINAHFEGGAVSDYIGDITVEQNVKELRSGIKEYTFRNGETIKFEKCYYTELKEITSE